MAAERGWRHRGYLDSGAHYPYSCFARLRWAAYLQNVIEGEHGGYGLSLFDFSSRKSRPRTSALVRLPEEPAPFRAWTEGGVVKPADYASATALGPRVKTALALRPCLSVETGSSALLVERSTIVLVAELPAFLDAAVSLATALVDDIRAAPLSPPSPPPRHPPPD